MTLGDLLKRFEGMDPTLELRFDIQVPDVDDINEGNDFICVGEFDPSSSVTQVVGEGGEVKRIVVTIYNENDLRQIV